MPTSNDGGATTAWVKAWENWVGQARRAAPAADAATAAGPRVDAADGLASAYLQFAKLVHKLATAGGQQAWVAQLIEALKTPAGQAGATAEQEALRAFFATSPQNLWGRVSGAGRDGLQQKMVDTWLSWTSEILDLPAVGPQREWLEAFKQIQRAALAEQAAASILNAQYEQASAAAMERFAAYLNNADSDPPITSLRQLYDAWIDHAEAAYADKLMAAEFGRDFAAWVNAGSQVRLALRAVADRIAILLDVPQRDEVNLLLERQGQLRAEVQELRAELRRRAAAPDAVVGAAHGNEAPPVAVVKRNRPSAKRGSSTRPRPAQPKKTAAGGRSSKSARDEFDIARILGRGD